MLYRQADAQSCNAVQAYEMLSEKLSSASMCQLFQTHMYLEAALPAGKAPRLPLALLNRCRDVSHLLAYDSSPRKLLGGIESDASSLRREGRPHSALIHCTKAITNLAIHTWGKRSAHDRSAQMLHSEWAALKARIWSLVGGTAFEEVCQLR